MDISGLLRKKRKSVKFVIEDKLFAENKSNKK